MRVPSRQAGYSMVEMMVVLLVLGISLAAGVPAFSRFLQSNSLGNAADEFAGHLRLARQTAVAQGVAQIVVWDPDAESYTLVTDTNGNDQADAGETTLGPYGLPKGITLTNGGDDGFTGDQVVFRPNGGASESGTVVFANRQGNTVNLSLLAPTGQVRIF